MSKVDTIEAWLRMRNVDGCASCKRTMSLSLSTDHEEENTIVVICAECGFVSRYDQGVVESLSVG